MDYSSIIKSSMLFDITHSEHTKMLETYKTVLKNKINTNTHLSINYYENITYKY